MNYLRSFTFLTLCLISFSSAAQFESTFQPVTSPVLSNPALTGTFDYGSFNLNRFGIGDYVRITDISYQTHLSSIKGGLGLSFQQHIFGFNKTNKTSLAYATQLQLNNKLTLSVGVNGTYASYKYLYFSHQFQQQPIILPLVPNKFNFDAGLLLYSNRFFVGLSAHQINNNMNPFVFKGQVGYQFDIRNTIEITPNITYTIQGQFNSFDGKLNLRYKDYKVMIGANFFNDYSGGVGWDRNRFSIHYIAYYSDSKLSSDFKSKFSNRFSVLIKIPKSIQKQNNTFDFSLF